ncbi:MAG: serine protease [Flavobacteriaceae bacterium]|nr:serine protease [Flavobacteriaceae bacterium]
MKDFSGTVLLHTNSKIDIALIKSDIKITPNHFELSDNGSLLGEDGYFLGFPFGLKMDNTSLNSGFPLPFVKKASISAIIDKDGISLQFLDGHNNPGFSGGPVVFKNRTGKSNYKWTIIGVISSYLNDSKELATPTGKIMYKENSGIILSYGSKHILEILEQK